MGLSLSDHLYAPPYTTRSLQNFKPWYTRARGCIARDRNLEVPWAAMRHQLLNIAVVSGSVWRYKVLRHSHAYYITHDIKVGGVHEAACVLRAECEGLGGVSGHGGHVATPECHARREGGLCSKAVACAGQPRQRAGLTVSQAPFTAVPASAPN